MEWIVTRHEGTISLLKKHFTGAEVMPHLDINKIKRGDSVYGVLPIHLIHEVMSRGATFYIVSLDIPPELRGKELSEEEVLSLNLRLMRVKNLELEEFTL